jgi:O-antigen/teichoic acid export membrane protein
VTSARPISLGARAAVVTAGQSVAKAADLIVAVILVRILSPGDWATMALLLSIYSVAIGLGGLNLHQGIYFFYGRLPPQDRRNLAVQTTGLLALTGVLAALIILALDPVLSGSQFRVHGLLPWLALTVLLEVPTLGAPQLLIAVERVGASAAFTAGASLVRIAAVTLPLGLGFGLQGAALGLLLYAALRLLAYGFLLVAITPPGPIRFDGPSVREQVRYSLPLGLSLATTLINRDVGKWLVAAFRPASFGAYTLAATEVPLIALLPAAVSTVLATRLVDAFWRGRRDLAHSYWLAATARASFLVLPATVGIILCAPQLFVVLFTRGYAAAVLPFQIFSLILLHRVTEYGGILRAAGDTRSLWLSSCVLLGGNLLLGVPLTLAFGMVGTAIAAVTANIFSWAFALQRISRTVHSTVTQVFPWRVYLRVLGVAIGAALASSLVARLAPSSPGIQLAVKLPVFALLFLAGAALFRLRSGLPELPLEAEPATVPGS